MSLGKFMRAWAVGAVCLAMGFGCSAHGEDSQSEGNTPGSELAESASETMTLELENQVAHAKKFGVSHVLVEIVAKDGSPQFSVEIRTGKEGEDTVLWTLHETLAEGQVSTGTMQVPYTELPSLEDSVGVAEFVQSNVSKALAGDEFDNWGCDLPRWVRTVSSCGPKGICCDIHDACFAKFKCTQSSWLKPWGKCAACNAAVVACMSSPTLPPIGPSACCFKGNCGRPR